MSVEELPHPHDLDLERALLGIVLLKPDSLATLSALIAAEDFLPLATPASGRSTWLWRQPTWGAPSTPCETRSLPRMAPTR